MKNIPSELSINKNYYYYDNMFENKFIELDNLED
jgi:hypothetical protein